MKCDPYPRYEIGKGDQKCEIIFVVQEGNKTQVPQALQQEFNKKNIITEGNIQYACPENVKLKKDAVLIFAPAICQMQNYKGIASNILCSAYYFSRKSVRHPLPTIYLDKDTPFLHQIIGLARSKNMAKELINGRGDIQGTPQYFVNLCKDFAANNKDLKMHVFAGDDLLKHGFRLLHAVGRASVYQPAFINLSYKGDQTKDEYVAFIGKGVVFDTGGLDIKSADGMRLMFCDKGGCCAVLSAFFTLIVDRPKINLTVSVGMVENSISQNAYRPGDIITSRKGLTVEIDNTDAEGRLVLADCMHWTQQNYKLSAMIEESTLTGAIIMALGNERAGLFSNNDQLAQELNKAGNEVEEKMWRMPIDPCHRKAVLSQCADLRSAPSGPAGRAIVAAAFLERFVQNVPWVHLDIAGTGMNSEGTGYGARLLVQFIRNKLKA